MRKLSFNEGGNGDPELEETRKDIKEKLNNSQDDDTDSEQDTSTSSDGEYDKDPENKAAAKIQRMCRNSLFSRNETRKAEAANKIQGLYKYFAAKPKPKFKYITWAGAKNSDNILGIKYSLSHIELLKKYKDSKLASERKEPAHGEADFYKKAAGSAKAFIKSNLDDLVAAYKGNEKLRPGQKETVKEIVEHFGIQYQLEMGAFVAACADKHDSFDTLFYQNAVGSTLESIVAEKNERYKTVDGRKPFEIRERKTSGNSVSGSREEAATTVAPDPANRGQTIFLPTAIILAFKALCDEIIDKNKYVASDVAIDKHFSTDFEGRKVLAPISIKSSCAAADGYNTADGIKGFVKSLDPRLEELTLVRVDTAHIWTELQVAILKKAKTCTETEFNDYLGSLFCKAEDGSFVVDEITGFYTLDKGSNIYKEIYKSTATSGEEWEKEFFLPMVDAFKKNHFTDKHELSIHAGISEKCSALNPNDAKKVFEEGFKYKSRYEEERDQVRQISKSYNAKLMPLIKDWLIASTGVDSTFAEQDTVKDPLERLGTLSIVVTLIDNNIFVDTVNKIAAEEKINKGMNARYVFSKETLISIKRKANIEIKQLLADNEPMRKGLYDLLEYVLDPITPCTTDSLSDDHEYILQIINGYVLDEGVKNADQFHKDSDTIYDFFRIYDGHKSQKVPDSGIKCGGY
jgi:hypothetical protein